MEEDQIKMHSMIISSGSQQTALQIYNKAIDHYKFKTLRSMDDALDNDCPPLAKINNSLAKKGNPDQLTKILKIMVATAAKEFNINRNIEPAQIDGTVEVIMSEFNYFKLSEVFFLLKQATLGRVEKTFERVDKPTIISWFDDWAAKRMHKFEERSLQKHHGATAGEKDRQYDNFIEKLQIQQSNEQQKEIKKIAYGMAKSMIANKHFQNQGSPFDQGSNALAGPANKTDS